MVSPVSYLTSTVPDIIPLVGSYTLCDKMSLAGTSSISTFISHSGDGLSKMIGKDKSDGRLKGAKYIPCI